jgi:cell division protein FtsB
VKIIALILLILLLMLQYGVWLGDGGIPEVLKLQDEVERVEADVRSLQERNQSLGAEVRDLKTGLEAIEERARSELGMIKQGETYYQLIGKRHDAETDQSQPGTAGVNPP